MELLPLVVVIAGIFILLGYNQRIKRLEIRVQELQKAIAGKVLPADLSESIAMVDTQHDVAPLPTGLEQDRKSVV